MTLSRSFAGWIMRLATRRPPPAHAEWALAMEGEFGTLERGEFGWALGCLTTRIGWTLRAQWLYILLLALPPLYLSWVNHLVFDLVWYDIVPRHAFTSFFRNYAALFYLLQPLPLAILIGAYRPDRIGTTLVFGCFLAQYMVDPLWAGFTPGELFSNWGEGSGLHGTPELVNLCASLWVWYMGASFGAWLARRRRSEPLASEAAR